MTERYIKLIVTYDGSAFSGFQFQPNVPTVQGELERAFALITRQKSRAVGAGRTDAGVHALNQVFHFDSELNISEDKWPLAINTLLPKDIYIKKVEQVNSDFHARFDAIGKKYRY